eukprot:COSAG01_NODE_3000_length_6737_cov_23.402079_1_plen_350_part_00
MKTTLQLLLAASTTATTTLAAPRRLRGGGGSSNASRPACDFDNIADLRTALTTAGCDLINHECSITCAVTVAPIVRECGYLIGHESRAAANSGSSGGRRVLQSSPCLCQSCMDNHNTRAQCASYGMDCRCAVNHCRCQSCLDGGSTKAQCISTGNDCTGCRGAHSRPSGPPPPPHQQTVRAFTNICKDTLHPSANGSETGAECSDGVDNDGDGNIDCNDVDCCYLNTCASSQAVIDPVTQQHTRTPISQVCQAYRQGNFACSQCSSFLQFSLCSDFINSVCCDEPNEDCSTGIPTTCNDDCASVLVPARSSCSTFLHGPHAGWAQVFGPMMDTAASLCQLGGGTQGGGH